MVEIKTNINFECANEKCKLNAFFKYLNIIFKYNSLIHVFLYSIYVFTQYSS